MNIAIVYKEKNSIFKKKAVLPNSIEHITLKHTWLFPAKDMEFPEKKKRLIRKQKGVEKEGTGKALCMTSVSPGSHSINISNPESTTCDLKCN